MYKLFVFALLIAAASAAVVAKSARIEGFNRVVQGPRQCGGQGALQEVRITDCSAQPCVFNPGKEYLFELDFEAGHNSDTLNLVAFAVIGGIPFEIVNVEVDQNTNPGSAYTIGLTVAVTADLVGTNFVLRSQVFGRPGSSLHICGEIDATVRN